MSTVAKSLKALSQADSAFYEPEYQGAGEWEDDAGNYYYGDESGNYYYSLADGSYYIDSDYYGTDYVYSYEASTGDSFYKWGDYYSYTDYNDDGSYYGEDN